MGIPLVPKSVTLSDLERRNGCYFALYHRIWQLWGQLKVVEGRPTLSATKCSTK